MPNFRDLLFVALLVLPALGHDFNEEACTKSFVEPTGDLHLLQSNVRKISNDKQIQSELNANQFVPWSGKCNKNNTIWDLGFYDGGDSQIYLDGGYCVLAVEADPTLVEQAKQKFAARIDSKQLTLLNMALAPETGATDLVGSEMTFYQSLCKKQWNSFLKTVGCRACDPPHNIADTACIVKKVSSKKCLELFQKHGTPRYLKLDIEGAEPGCFEGMQQLAKESKPLPEYISAEVTSPKYVDTMHKLGYKKFKLVRQDLLMTDGKGHSGPWGDDARDCRAGLSWRSYKEVRNELEHVLEPWEEGTMMDPCPKGVQNIREEGKGTVWYDVHAAL